MPLIQYCPNCWAENTIDATVCERCSTSLSETAAIFYDQKLMRALHHPVPETREMAATLLGQRRDQRALPVLMSVCSKRPTSECSTQSARLWENWETAGPSPHFQSALRNQMHSWWH